MRNIIVPLIATATIAITPGCSKQSPVSETCLSIENDIRLTCSLISSSYEYHLADKKVNVGTTRLDDLCSRAMLSEKNAEREYRRYVDNCDVFEENSVKNRIKELRALRMKICEDIGN